MTFLIFSVGKWKTIIKTLYTRKRIKSFLLILVTESRSVTKR